MAEEIAGYTFAETFRYSAVDPFPVFCTVKNSEVHYFLNAADVPHDVQISVICIKETKACTQTDGNTKSAFYPCTCGTDSCYQNEYCNAAENICEIYPGFAETQKFGKTCPTGYQEITDATACMELANTIADPATQVGKRWGAVYSDWTYPHGCTSWRGDIINYYVNDFSVYNPTAYSYAVDAAKICIKTSKACSSTDGVSTSSSYPCTCGTDTCANNEICGNSTGPMMCELIQGIYQTERKVHSCPTGYRTITQTECYTLAPNISRAYLEFQKYSGVAQTCGTWNFRHVNYFDYPGGGHPGRAYTDDERNPENALLCVQDAYGALPSTLRKDQFAVGSGPFVEV